MEVNLCLECPDGTRGMCCHINIPMEGFNIVLEHVRCPQLDLETMLCSDYENRKQIGPWCMHGEGMFGKGGLPKGCLYIIDHPEKEPFPKVKIREILPSLTLKEQQKLVALYNVCNNVPFEIYVQRGLAT